MGGGLQLPPSLRPAAPALNGEIGGAAYSPRIYSGTLGLNQSPSATPWILGERLLQQANSGPIVIAASTDALVAAAVPFTLNPNQALMIELMMGAFGESDANGQLSLLAALAGIASNGAQTLPTVWFPIFGQVGPMPKILISPGMGAYSFYVQTPPPFRDRDVRGSFAATVQLAVVVVGVFRNNDGAASHTATANLSMQSRIITGVSP